MGYRLGIDVGTTYTAAAVSRSVGGGWSEPESITLGTRGATVPSVLYVAADGTVVVGEAAERRAVTDPDRVVRQFKRRIGDRTPIVAGGRPWAPEDLSARLLRWVVDRAAEREGGPPDAIAVTHPASWGPHKKDLFGRALAAQGLSVTFLTEPQAAAISYAASERVPAGATIAVYDLGGGTFDAAVVRKGDGAGPGGFDLLGRPEGLERLGGIDFDQVVFDHVRAGLPDAFTDLDDTDPAVLSAVAQLRRECTEAKEALSSDTDVAVPVMLPGSRGSVRLHRSEFEALIRPAVEETVSALRRAVASAGLAPDQLTSVLLVGGSSRIPLVGALVSEQLGRPVAVDADPKNAIAKGAALAIAPRPATRGPAAGPPTGPGRPAAVAGAAGVAAGAAGLPPQAPPPRPSRSGLPTPPAPTGQPPQSWQPPPPSRPERPVHEPANSLYSGSDEPVRPRRTEPRPARADRYTAPADYDRDYDYDGRRRGGGRGSSTALLAVGGVIAAVALVVGVVFLTSQTGTTDAGSPTGTPTTTSAPSDEPGPARPPAATSDAPRTTTAPEPTTEPAEPTTTQQRPTPTSEEPAPTTSASGSAGGGTGLDLPTSGVAADSTTGGPSTGAVHSGTGGAVFRPA